MMLPNEKSTIFISVSVVWMCACKIEKNEEFEDKAFPVIKRKVVYYCEENLNR